MTCTSNTVITDFAASLAIVFGFLEEQLLERHSPDLPIGVDGLTHGKPALTRHVKSYHGDEIHVHVFALHVNTTPDPLEPNRSGDLWRSARGLGADAGRDRPSDFELVALVMEFEMPPIVSIEYAVAMLHVGANASAKVLEH
jgi:hypothetical protein